MAQIIFGKMTGLADSIYGKSEAPIKAFLEENVKAYTDSSMVEKIFKVVSSDNYAEKYSSLTGLAQGFLPVGEGGAYPKDERQEGFAKVLEHETWKDSFTITQEMIEDSKILDLNRTGARGFVDQYAFRKPYPGKHLFGVVGKISCKHPTEVAGISMEHSSHGFAFVLAEVEHLVHHLISFTVKQWSAIGLFLCCPDDSAGKIHVVVLLGKSSEE